MKSLKLTLWILFLLPAVCAYSQDDHYLAFDGADDYVPIQMQYSGTNAIGNLTVEAWIKTSFNGSSYSDNWAIIDFDRSDFYNVYVRGDNGHLGFSTYAGGIDDFQGTISLNDGEWHHVAAVYDGVNKYIYVDGVLDATAANPHSGAALGKSTTRFGIIGDGSEATSYNGSRNNRYYDGSISELRIWHSVKTDTELQTNMVRNSLNGTEPGLEAYYTFNNGLVTDLTGNGHDGELFGPTFMVEDGFPDPSVAFEASTGISTNGANGVTNWSSIMGSLVLTQPTSGLHPILITDGINGHPALQFDGVDDFLQIPDLNGLNTGGPFLEKSLVLVFETSADITTRQMLYEQGGGTRGLSMYIENGRLYYTAWNVAEDNWGPIVLGAPLGTSKRYVASMVLDANTGTLSAFLNSHLMDTATGVLTLYAHGDDGGLGNTNGSTRFAAGGSASAFQGKVAYWASFNQALTNQERSGIEQLLVEKYVTEAEPDPTTIATDQTHVPTFNGNISAIRWRGAHDAQEQLYTFNYDGLNRLQSAQYAAKSGDAYTHNRGYYSVPSINYDLNGNITQLTRQGLTKNGNEDIIDELAYVYGVGTPAHSNQLMRVSDARGSAGFNDGQNAGDDYTYDANGNMIQDLNKEITSIAYNYLNLPSKVTFNTTGDSITYLYDAAGIKLQRVVYQGGDTVKLTDYVEQYIYENDTLQFIQQEEGRIVPKYSPDGSSVLAYDYQYHLKDHLGNVRTTFSTELENYTNAATFEDGAVAEESASFGNVDQNRFDHPSVENTGKAARLNYLTPAGPYTVIKVQPRDTVSLSVTGYYEGGSGYANSADPALFETALGNAIKGSPLLASEGIGASQIENGLGIALGLLGIGGSGDDNVPGSYLNYLFFDEQMNLVTDDDTGLPFAGFKQISSDANFSEETLEINEIIADQTGYIIAYLSNESNNGNSNDYVYFDDFTVYHGKTNVVSSQDYYPFGLTFNEEQRTASTPQRYKYNGKELQEETEWYDYGARHYDAQLGRFVTQDRFAEKYVDFSPYQYAANNPILFVDVNGDSINVAEQYRAQFNSALEGAFGERAGDFSFNGSGNLVFNGDVKNFKGKERRALKTLLKGIGNVETVNVVFEEIVTIGDVSISVNDQGGGITILPEDVTGIEFNEALIAVSPTGPTESSALVRGTKTDAEGNETVELTTEKIKSNLSISTFHELGHFIFPKASDGPQIIGFDNQIRAIQKTRQPDGSFKKTPFSKRGVDITHDPKSATGGTRIN